MKKKNNPFKLISNVTIIAAVISGLFLIINTIISKENVSLETIPAVNNTIIGNKNNIIEGDSNTIIGSITINKNEQIIKESKTQILLNNISLTPDNKYLYKVLAKKYKLFLNNKATTKILITTTGEINKLEQFELYVYSGGQLAISVNGNICHVFEDFAIEASSKYGNSKSNINEYIRNKIESNINKHYFEIANYINKCAKQ